MLPRACMLTCVCGSGSCYGVRTNPGQAVCHPVPGHCTVGSLLAMVHTGARASRGCSTGPQARESWLGE